MSYVIEGLTIRRPNGMTEGNSTQFAQQRPLAGNVARDYFGANKRVWTLNWDNLNVTDYTVLNQVYQDYLVVGARSFQITEPNYSISALCHIDLPQRAFSIPGSSYISDVTMTLTEA